MCVNVESLYKLRLDENTVNKMRLMDKKGKELGSEVMDDTSELSSASSSWKVGDPNLKKWKKIGSYTKTSYAYTEPESEDSNLFLDFFVERPEYEEFSPTDIYSYFAPPTIKDFAKHLEKFDACVDEIPKESYEKLGDYLDLELEPFGIFNNFLNKRRLAEVRMPTSTSPGLSFKRLGFRTKKESLKVAIPMVAERIECLVNNSVCRFEEPISKISGRGKLKDPAGANYSQRDGRLVLVPPTDRHLMGSLASQLITDKMVDLNVNTDYLGFGLGTAPYGPTIPKLFRRVENLREQHSKTPFFSIFSTDMESCDQTITASIIKLLFQKIRRRFPSALEIDRYFEQETRWTLYTLVAWFNGSVFMKQDGVSSGDPWTALINTFVTRAVIRISVESLGLKCFNVSGGDDGLGCAWGDRPLTIQELSEITRNGFGMIISRKKSRIIINRSGLVPLGEQPDYEQHAQFFSTFVDENFHPMPNKKDVLMTMLHPETGLMTIAWEKARTISALLLSLWNIELYTLLLDYWDYLVSKYPDYESFQPDDRDMRFIESHPDVWISMFFQRPLSLQQAIYVYNSTRLSIYE
jgi:hypothetical protein